MCLALSVGVSCVAAVTVMWTVLVDADQMAKAKKKSGLLSNHWLHYWVESLVWGFWVIIIIIWVTEQHKLLNHVAVNAFC